MVEVKTDLVHLQDKDGQGWWEPPAAGTAVP